ncbi:MAG: hypothetical protein LBG88_03640 [Christensenellaceae bacterium]|nr:hypothetical protein [Christensenellaceae bacterium]
MDFENMQPEIARRMLPHIEEAIDTYDTGDNLSDDDINRMASHVVSASGAAIDPPAGHSVRTANDFARALVLARLAQEAGFSPFFPFYYPFFFPTFPPFAQPPRRPSSRPPVRPRPPVGRPPMGGGRPR